ncbi:hypothetical protein CANCADRAFT_52168 [Tortispora caseinolytica NRRL Y-17796]|uniref:Golgi apparatus membrane protein TVP23 n=1 Tax=Tortispora caseinolytica NRRL Y-17796 TaxID=767744 RepID=A0A1E4THS3_9ASCO|nr:hypothetical protein CANCADRAFT_52168 [Tortispora caseinolytica NRRL Y-17796]
MAENEYRISLSSKPSVLITFLAFRIASLLTYLLGLLFTSNFVLVFIIVMLLLAADFWYTKNVAGRLLVGLRWWNETSEEGESIWVFESADPQREMNATDSKFFWTTLYLSPTLWMILGLVAILKFEFIWLTLVVIAVSLSLTNTLAFGRCDKWSKATGIANGIFANSLLRNFGGSLVSRLWS